MATLSNNTYYNAVIRKKTQSPLQAYTINSQGDILETRLVDNFLYLLNHTSKDYSKLFPVDSLKYIDLELLEDGSFLFVIVDRNGLSFQIRNFEKGTLHTVQQDVDKDCHPSIILKGDNKGAYYSVNGRIVYRPYVDGVLGDEKLIATMPKEFLDYALYDEANSCVKLVIKVRDKSKISDDIVNFESKDFTRVLVDQVLEKKV